MRILCLHGRGSNNDIFKMQTAGFRSLLDDYEFDFVQGQMPHTEGNWSLHTKDFSSSSLWGYFNLLDLEDIVETEQQVLQLAAENGPYDGILGYSQGATLAAQVLIKDALETAAQDPEHHHPPFKFAIFFNGATPSRVFKVPSKPVPIIPDLTQPLALKFLHAVKANPLLGSTGLYPAAHPTQPGRQMLTDGTLGMMKSDAALDGKLIQIPTLHVRCETDVAEHGEELYNLCDPQLAEQYFHIHKHDFPRGYNEMRGIARLIRQTAERACEL
ncbi:serine hydrolase FSH [Leptodontidium sp. MPI-SDFR-AT-0119]|nr:serine hydrolase FSH [Leptodontidium sp. MPI-SDFR-AT-0119]